MKNFFTGYSKYDSLKTMKLFADQTIADLPLDPSIQELPPGDYGAAFAKMILTMIALVLLMCVTVWFLRKLIQKRLEKGSGNQMIQVIEKKMISPKTMLYVVKIEGKQIVLAESHLEIRPIHSLTESDSTIK